MFRIMKIYVNEKIQFLTFSKYVMGVFKVKIFWAWKIFEQILFFFTMDKKSECD